MEDQGSDAQMVDEVKGLIDQIDEGTTYFSDMIKEGLKTADPVARYDAAKRILSGENRGKLHQIQELMVHLADILKKRGAMGSGGSHGVPH